jgi:peptidoglycan hydrolase-like protein with peptidoglycan-binding domain
LRRAHQIVHRYVLARAVDVLVADADHGAGYALGDELVAIVKRFQAAAGLEETGVTSVDLQDLIYSDAAPLSPSKAAEAQDDLAAASVVINPLMSGDSGDDVTALQTRLAELGYYSGTADGKYGSGTEKAVSKLQTALGFEPTGEATADLINIIDSSAAPKSGDAYYSEAQSFASLQKGDTGDAVVELQRRLWELGYLVKEDISDSIGTYEEHTAQAVDAVSFMDDWGSQQSLLISPAA